MAGQASQNDDMQSRLEQQQRLQGRREWILQQPNERCPRCDSLDTKFAYFNNHRETQPRYLCKGCRKFWTKGGKQRTAAPVGGAAISLGGGLIMVPATSLSTWTLLGSAGRSSLTGGPAPQVQSNNIQPPRNVIGNAPNSFTPVWRAPNPGLSHFQPAVQNNIRPPPNVVQASVHPPNVVQPSVHNNIQPLPPNVVQPSVHNNIQPLPPNVVHPSGSPPNVVPNLPNSFRAPGWQVPPNQGLRPLQPFVGSNIQPNFNNYVPNPFDAAQPAPNHGLAPLPPSLDNYTYLMGGATS